MKITKEELARGNIDFIVAACMKLAFDKEAVYQTIRRANLTYERQRYDGLQASEPAAGFLFVDPTDAGELITELTSNDRLFYDFMEQFNEDVTREGKWVKNAEATLVQVPFENRYRKFMVGLNITGYTEGRPLFTEVKDPYQLNHGTFLERLADLKFFPL